jgi:putative transposase
MSIDWPHAPVHRLDSAGIFMVTAATLHKNHLFADAGKLTLLEHGLLSLAKQYQWQLEAWAVFTNHYHFVARRKRESASLKKLLTHLHADSARDLNRMDEEIGREVWFNFWDTKLTYERSYLARLNYVHPCSSDLNGYVLTAIACVIRFTRRFLLSHILVRM